MNPRVDACGAAGETPDVKLLGVAELGGGAVAMAEEEAWKKRVVAVGDDVGKGD